jgi:hypothetical protein
MKMYKGSSYSLIFFTRTSNSIRSSTTTQLKLNMQFTLSALTTLAIVTLAVATPTRRNDTPPPTSECDTGSTQCCDSTSTASNPTTAALLASLGIPIGSVTGIVGLTCSPITGVGVSGTSWFVYDLSPFLIL